MWSETLADLTLGLEVDVPRVGGLTVLDGESEDAVTHLDGLLLLLLILANGGLDDIEGGGGWDGVCMWKTMSVSYFVY